jgi:hypothetical protein
MCDHWTPDRGVVVLLLVDVDLVDIGAQVTASRSTQNPI